WPRATECASWSRTVDQELHPKIGPACSTAFTELLTREMGLVWVSPSVTQSCGPPAETGGSGPHGWAAPSWKSVGIGRPAAKSWSIRGKRIEKTCLSAATDRVSRSLIDTR